MADVTIKVQKNGPYVITDPVVVLDEKGDAIATERVVALCRCGQSQNKPFCDGSHNTTSFVGTCKHLE